MASRFEIRVNGRVSDQLAGSLGLRADVHPVETTLHADIRDRVELGTLLGRLSDIGLDVVALRRVNAGELDASDAPRS